MVVHYYCDVTSILTACPIQDSTLNNLIIVDIPLNHPPPTCNRNLKTIDEVLLLNSEYFCHIFNYQYLHYLCFFLFYTRWFSHNAKCQNEPIFWLMKTCMGTRKLSVKGQGSLGVIAGKVNILEYYKIGWDDNVV